MFWKKSWICGGNRSFPYKTLKFKDAMFSLMFAFSLFLAQNANILVQAVLNLQKIWSERAFWKKSWICGANYNFPYKTLKFSVQVSMFSLMFVFFSVFGTKRKHTRPTSSESAKNLIRIGVLEEKLDLWWKSQFPVQDA